MYRPSLDEFKELSKRGNLIPVFREILADEETPVTALMKLKSSAHVFLLESVEGGEKWGRYTFLGADPRFVFRVVSDEVEIRENGSTQRLKHGGNPLTCLKKLRNSKAGWAYGFFSTDSDILKPFPSSARKAENPSASPPGPAKRSITGIRSSRWCFMILY